jgi:hypothetical protein
MIGFVARIASIARRAFASHAVGPLHQVRLRHNVRCSSQPSKRWLASLAFLDSAAAELGR